MRAIIIGAGRGRRLMPTTADTPKCYAEIGGRRILDWTLEAFEANGLTDICFIGGYQIDKVRGDYPNLTFRHNADWENNNILASLMCAEDLMNQAFICCYSDILFTPKVVSRLLTCHSDIGLVTDTHWLDRYQHRSEHPPDDAEKMTVHNGYITRVDRAIPTGEAYGEYIGVAKFSGKGAALLRENYEDCKNLYAGEPFRGAATFEKAYLIHLFQEMIESGIRMSHIDTPGEYMEIDTQQDFELAREHWPAREPVAQ